ncbi:hypothetical protein HUU53_01045 [Candidatus Micrarchaeota archaeon]|nr:hypothetical protein [Candidatus Micrarchaeota archaeon]
MYRKGQLFSIDFLIATAFFIALLSVFLAYWDSEYDSVYYKTQQSKMNAAGQRFSNALLFEDSSFSLVESSGVLNYSKIDSFLNLDYEESKRFVGFDYFVQAKWLNGSIAFSKGNYSRGIAFNRLALLDGEEINLRVVVLE